MSEEVKIVPPEPKPIEKFKPEKPNTVPDQLPHWADEWRSILLHLTIPYAYCGGIALTGIVYPWSGLAVILVGIIAIALYAVRSFRQLQTDPSLRYVIIFRWLLIALSLIAGAL